jgi:hypothetical protein
LGKTCFLSAFSTASLFSVKIKIQTFSKPKDKKLRKGFLPVLILIPLFFSCSSGKPPDELFHDNVKKMVLVDRAMRFKEEVTKISIVSITKYEDQVEAEVRVEGWAVHRDLRIGATLPVSKEKKSGWATWKFFLTKKDDDWIIMEKFKVAEGFVEQ